MSDALRTALLLVVVILCINGILLIKLVVDPLLGTGAYKPKKKPAPVKEPVP